MSDHNKSMETIKGQIKNQNALNKEMGAKSKSWYKGQLLNNKSDAELEEAFSTEEDFKLLDDLWNELGLTVQRQGGK